MDGIFAKQTNSIAFVSLLKRLSFRAFNYRMTISKTIEKIDVVQFLSNAQ